MARTRPVIIALLAVAVALQPLSGARTSKHRRTAVTDTNAALPMRPSPDLEPIEIVNACFGGLRTPDDPLPDAGYERDLFHFCVYVNGKAIHE